MNWMGTLSENAHPMAETLRMGRVLCSRLPLLGHQRIDKDMQIGPEEARPVPARTHQGTRQILIAMHSPVRSAVRAATRQPPRFD